MFNYKSWLLFFFTCLFLIPVSFFAGAISFKLFLLAPVFSVLFLVRLAIRQVDFYLKKFEPDELAVDLFEGLLSTAKIALGVHELNFQIKVFRNVEPHAFALRGFRHERIIFLSSGLIRSVSETELREVFKTLYERLNDSMSPWAALYTMIYLWFLPSKEVSKETPWQFWVHVTRVSLSRMILRKTPTFKTKKDAADSQTMRFNAASYGDFIFLSPLFLGPKVSQEYGSLESILIRE